MELLVQNEDKECRRNTGTSPSRSVRSQHMKPLLKTHVLIESSVE